MSTAPARETPEHGPRRGLRLVRPEDGRPGREKSRQSTDVRMLFEQLRERGDPGVRERLIERHLGLVDYLAKRFAGRGQSIEDLVQVGRIGLIKAVDRFDERRGFEFSTFATPTIVGELKRHFRDRAWGVRVPRGLQELALDLGNVGSKLSQELGRAPTVSELAEASGATEEDVLEALESSKAYTPESLDAPYGEEDAPLSEQVGYEDEGLELAEDLVALRPAVEALPSRDRRILYLRFFKGMTQNEIAAELGISQMHVSRLLAGMIRRLRDGLDDERDLHETPPIETS